MRIIMKKALLLLLVCFLWCVSLTAASLKEMAGFLDQPSKPVVALTLSEDNVGPVIPEMKGGDPLKPRRFRGYTLKEMHRQGRINLGMLSLYGGIHSGQFLNPSFGMLQESGHLIPKLGGFGGVMASQYYPILLNFEYAIHSDSLESRSVLHMEFSGFASLAVFPWFYSEYFSVVPVIGVGLQHGMFEPSWRLSPLEPEKPKDVVVQPLYRVGMIINFVIDTYRIQIIGNYYRSMFIKNQPHALNGYTLGIGFGGM